MISSNIDNTHSSSALVQKLVCHILNKPTDAVKSEYRSALRVLKCPVAKFDCDEFVISEQIYNKLKQEGKAKDATTFVKLLLELQSSSVLTNRVSVLHFLYSLYGFSTDTKNLGQLANCFSESASPDSDLALNSQALVNKQMNKSVFGAVDLSGFTIEFHNESEVQFPEYINTSNCEYNIGSFPSTAFKATGTTHPDRLLSLTSNVKHEPEKATSDESNLGVMCYAQPNLRNLLRDILYAFQGLSGNIIHWEPEKNNFNVVFKEEFPKPVKKLTLRLVELGWMYCRIKQYCITQNNEKSLGVIEQSFVAALESKLFDYYKLIAELEAGLNQESTLEHLYSSSNSLTLHRMSVRFFEPHIQLKFLALVVDACKGKKGGALVSVLYSYLHHGDPFVKSLIQNLLRDVTQPLFKMLSNWIFCGELRDVFGEFFVATDIAIPHINPWQDKYILNKEMIPSFITMEQARKILSIGKAINFLHQVCQDKTFAFYEDCRIKEFEHMSTESLLSQGKDAKFENAIEKNYAKASKTVLQVLLNKYNLMDHLLAMKNYFLLGQGDFIRHLMDLLDTELAKPSVSIYIHNLSAILESAIRATNAQNHCPDVLQRLDVKLIRLCYYSTGWDLFRLDYHVDGPVDIVLTTTCMNSYFKLFRTLWRAKRMEYILCKISRSRTTYLMLQAKVPSVTPVLYQSHINLAHMVNFMQQIQYYMAFDGMECCWADLLLKISSTQNLDQVIAAHDNFLDTLLKKPLLDEESHVYIELRMIYELIIKFDKIHNSFWNEVSLAVNKLDEINATIKANPNKVGWGISDQQEKELMAAWHKLKTYRISDTKGELKALSRSFDFSVEQFLILLNEQDDPNFRFLSLRLDFDEQIKSRNYHLQKPPTYQHCRKFIK